MRNNWKKINLNEILDLIIDYRGKTPKKLGGYWSEDGIRVVSAKNIKTGEAINDRDVRFVDENLYRKWMKKELQVGDILLTSEAPLGEMLYLKTNNRLCLSQRLFALRFKNEIYSKFIYYYFQSDVGRGELYGRATGTTVKGIRQSELLKVEVATPKFEDQKRIADVLSAYDDLIENNNRRIKILEEMAQLIYKEWFVDFKFPGHEKVKMVEGELGLMPDDWVACKLKNVMEIIRGRSYSRLEIDCEEGYNFVNLKCFNRGGGFRRGGLKKYSGKVKDDQFLQVGDIVMAVTDMTQQREIVARVAMIPKIGKDKITFSCDVVKILPKNIDGKFLYFMLRFGNFADEIKNKANGANVLHLNSKNIEEYVFINPTNALADKFGKIAGEISQEMDLLNLKSNNLRQTRDLLLPKLMSGEINL